MNEKIKHMRRFRWMARANLRVPTTAASERQAPAKAESYCMSFCSDDDDDGDG